MRDLFDGLTLGHAAAERAADHAGEEWKDRAYSAFTDYARDHKTFTTEDVRRASDVGEPPDNRAWGAVALRAKRAGVVRHIDFARVKDPCCHSNVVSLWEAI
jgi:hypothetical protein